jgi:hypothetical protein
MTLGNGQRVKSEWLDKRNAMIAKKKNDFYTYPQDDGMKKKLADLEDAIMKQAYLGGTAKSVLAKRGGVQETREELYTLFRYVCDKLRGDGIFLKPVHIDLNESFFEVTFEDESLKDFSFLYSRQDNFRLCFDRRATLGYPAPIDDPLRPRLPQKEIAENLYCAVKGEYVKWYKKLMTGPGVTIKNPLPVIVSACRLLEQRKRLVFNVHELTQEGPQYVHASIGASLPQRQDFILNLSMNVHAGPQAPYSVADVKLLLTLEDFSIYPCKLDKIANIPDSVIGWDRVKLRLGFMLFKAWKKIAFNVVDANAGKDGYDRVVGVSYSF